MSDGKKAIIGVAQKQGKVALIVVGSIVAAVALFYGVRLAYNKIQKGAWQSRSKRELKEQDKELKETTPKPSYKDSEYVAMADHIEQAVDGAGTDEDAIYDVLRKMKNNQDMVKLQTAYGIRFGDEDLYESIKSDMSSSEIAKCNNILQGNGITITI
jgi:hypothetical protein